MPKKTVHSRKPPDYGPDVIEEYPAPENGTPVFFNGDVLAFFRAHLVPLFQNCTSEKAFIQQSTPILKSLWRQARWFRDAEDREQRGREPFKNDVMGAIAQGVAQRVHGRSGKPTQGDLSRMIEDLVKNPAEKEIERLDGLDESVLIQERTKLSATLSPGRPLSEIEDEVKKELRVRRTRATRLAGISDEAITKYAKLYRLESLEPYDAHTEGDWKWLAQHDADYVHRAFSESKLIRDSVKRRADGIVGDSERVFILRYIKICRALQKLGDTFSAPGYYMVFRFPARRSNK